MNETQRSPAPALKGFLASPTVWLAGLIALVVNAVCWFIVWKYTQGKTELVPIHYNTIIGIDRIGSASELYLSPAIGTGLALINFAAAALFRRERAAATILLVFGVFVSIIALAAVSFIAYEFQ